jgi:hypothetical protein
MARIIAQYIANDGTPFATAGEARAHNEQPADGVREYLAHRDLPQRKVTEYMRLLTAWEAWNASDQR